MPSVADGLRVRRVGRLARQLCAEHLEQIVMVSEQEVCRAMAQLGPRLACRGAGAAVYAAIARRGLAVITGGNVDAAAMRQALGAQDDDSGGQCHRTAGGARRLKIK